LVLSRLIDGVSVRRSPGAAQELIDYLRKLDPSGID